LALVLHFAEWPGVRGVLLRLFTILLASFRRPEMLNYNYKTTSVYTSKLFRIQTQNIGEDVHFSFDGLIYLMSPPVYDHLSMIRYIFLSFSSGEHPSTIQYVLQCNVLSVLTLHVPLVASKR
jgi:hypothetical protein